MPRPTPRTRTRAQRQAQGRHQREDEDRPRRRRAVEKRRAHAARKEVYSGLLEGGRLVLDVEGDVERGRAVREPAERDEVDARLRDLAHVLGPDRRPRPR